MKEYGQRLFQIYLICEIWYLCLKFILLHCIDLLAFHVDFPSLKEMKISCGNYSYYYFSTIEFSCFLLSLWLLFSNGTMKTNGLLNSFSLYVRDWHPSKMIWKKCFWCCTSTVSLVLLLLLLKWILLSLLCEFEIKGVAAWRITLTLMSRFLKASTYILQAYILINSRELMCAHKWSKGLLPNYFWKVHSTTVYVILALLMLSILF